MEQILMSGAIGILKKLTSVVSEQIGLGWGVKDDLIKLQGTLDMLLAVVADAEKRQEKDQLLRLWLRRLKGVAYDADDVMDEFAYESMHRCERGDRLKHKVVSFVSSSNPLAFRFKMARKIKNINRCLDEITNDMGRFQLQMTSPIPDGGSADQLDRHVTTLVNESEIVGRENDESQIIKLLTTNPTSSTSPEPNQYPEKVYVISIVGMGGLGKTTLAQLAYKDELVKKVFELTIWVHVSEIFDLETILVNIMESITETKFHAPSNLHVLVDIVQKQLSGKKYLLVLDDLWNEDSQQWESLKSVLLVGAPGSKILITTRNDQVAFVVRGSIPPYDLSKLEDDACWSIIKQKAFSPGGAIDAPKLSDIGKQIANKCCGLPLAAKFLGSLLHLKNRESDWISIRDDDIWNTPESKRKVLPVLKMSYNNLPSHLKQCFSYCSIFPKNWEISKDTLVRLWMAEGFLKQSDMKSKKSMEDFGYDYFESLAWCSFFHDFKKNELDEIQTCKMHDIVHDLAVDVLGENELVSLKVSEFADVSEVRRLHLDLDEDISTAFLKNSGNLKKLRTLFIPEGVNLVDPSIFSDINHLRILHVGPSPDDAFLRWRSLRVKLKHLRYLHLTSLYPKDWSDLSITKLYSLETLVFNNMSICVRNILMHIQSLKKLRHLEVSCTYLVYLPDSVTSLCNLQTLDLNNCNLDRFPNSISRLKNLRFLNLSHNDIETLPVSLFTLSNLDTLDVSSCEKLKSLPEYVAGLANLRIFDFKNCPLLDALPKDFGALTQLRYLNLEGTKIRLLPESCANLNNLEFVSLWWCELPKYVKNWTQLKVFVHLHRSKQHVLGVGKLVFLEELVYLVPINESESNIGVEELGNLNFLKVIVVGDLQNIKDPIDAERANLKGKQKLGRLVLGWDEIKEDLCMRRRDIMLRNDLRVFEALQPPTGLKSLNIANFMGLDLPAWMCVPSGLPELDWLELRNCRGIQQLPASIGQLPHLRCLELGEISLKSLDIGGFPSLIRLELTDMFMLEELCYSYPCLQELCISGCKSLTEIPLFPSLETLILKKINHKLVCSVGRIQTSLTSICLENIEELIDFPISILQNNCNLQRLDFIDCPVLKFLPDLRRWTSLQQLSIFKCPQVRGSLTYDLKSLSFLKELYVDFIQAGNHMFNWYPSVSEDLINLLD